MLRCIRILQYPSNKISKLAHIFICHNQVIRCEFRRILYFFASTTALWNSGASYPFKKETVSLYLWLLIFCWIIGGWYKGLSETIWLTGWAVDTKIGGTSFWFKLRSSWFLQSANRSTSEVVDGLLRFDHFLVLGFFPAVFGAPPNAILVIDALNLDLLYQVINSGNLAYFSATGYGVLA